MTPYNGGLSAGKVGIGDYQTGNSCDQAAASHNHFVGWATRRAQSKR